MSDWDREGLAPAAAVELQVAGLQKGPARNGAKRQHSGQE